VDLSREDFLAGNFDLNSLFSLLFDRFYSEDFVRGSARERRMDGRLRSSEADVFEPINTLLEMGLASIVSFRPTEERQIPRGISSPMGNRSRRNVTRTGRPVRWRTVRAWKSRRVIAERIGIYCRQSRESVDDAHVDLEREELRIFEE